MPNYSHSIIYKIQHITNKDLYYIGGTTDFKNRRSAHRNYWKTGRNELYQMIRDNNGWDNFDMIQIKEFPCKDKFELEAEKCKMEHKEEMRQYITNLIQ